MNEAARSLEKIARESLRAERERQRVFQLYTPKLLYTLHSTLYARPLVASSSDSESEELSARPWSLDPSRTLHSPRCGLARLFKVRRCHCPRCRCLRLRPRPRAWRYRRSSRPWSQPPAWPPWRAVWRSSRTRRRAAGCRSCGRAGI